MSDTQHGLLGRVSAGPVRRQYLYSVLLLTVVLLLTAAISGAAVVWASTALRDNSDRIVALQGANREIRQSMTDAQLGIRGLGMTENPPGSITYEFAMYWLPLEQRELRDLAQPGTRLEAAVTRQDEAIREWSEQYADLAIRAGAAPVEDPELFKRGDLLFARFQSASEQVDTEIETLTRRIRERSEDLMGTALVAVVLIPLVAVGAVVLGVGRVSRDIVRSLHDIADVQRRLGAGDTTARAQVTGPQEIREIAAGLNKLTEDNARASEVEADVLSQLQSIDRVRTDLVSTVSHELRTPLTSINGYFELLRDEIEHELDDRQRSMTDVIARNLERLNALITDLLQLSRAEETEFAVEPVDLRAVASEVATDIRLTAAIKEVTVRTLQAASAVVVLGDRSQLVRAVTNLAANAVKFSRPGGAVEIRVVAEGAEAVLEVVDEGIGIPAADLPEVGSRFYRASNAMAAEIGGTGLGLRIVQTILSRHDGSLALESVEGQGTTVTMRLPLSRSTLDGPWARASH